MQVLSRFPHLSIAIPTMCAVFFFSAVISSAQTASKQDAAQPETHGIAIANMDPSVKPGDNFYQYANGAWIARTVIPADRAGMGVFSVLSDLSNKRTAALIEEA